MERSSRQGTTAHPTWPQSIYDDTLPYPKDPKSLTVQKSARSKTIQNIFEANVKPWQARGAPRARRVRAAYAACVRASVTRPLAFHASRRTSNRSCRPFGRLGGVLKWDVQRRRLPTRLVQDLDAYRPIYAHIYIYKDGDGR